MSEESSLINRRDDIWVDENSESGKVVEGNFGEMVDVTKRWSR